MELLLRRESAHVRKRYRELVDRARRRNTVARLEQMLEEGKASVLVDEFERVANGVASAREEVVASAAATEAQELARVLKADIFYNTGNPRAVAAMQANRARLVVGLVEDQRVAITEALSEGIRAGFGPKQQAATLRSIIGLTPSQARWVANYRAKLERLDRGALEMALRDKRFDAATRKAIESGKPLTSEQIDKMVERYYQRAIGYRAEVIARTEVLRATHEASEEAHLQAIESGQLTEERVQRTWIARMVRTRHSHASMHRQKRRLGVPFRSGNGSQLRYPCDANAPASETVQCQCAVTTRILPEGRVAVNG